MGRVRRHSEAGGYYHVTARGNGGRPIQVDGIDCAIWELMLARVVRLRCWEVLSYCLLTNHFHLVLRIPESGLSEGMCLLNGGFARQFNLRHGLSDHLFGRRFWSAPIEDDDRLKAALQYVAINPVRAGLAAAPERYRWSGHRALAGLAHPPAFLAVGAALSPFGPDPTRARDAYRSLVRNARVPVPGTVTRA